MAKKTSKERPVYRMVHPAMFADPKFRALTPLQPSGQALWMLLLVSHENGPIPGMILDSLEGMAKRFRWPVRALRAHAKELSEAGMIKIDNENCIIWLVNGIKWNPPANGKMVKGWAKTWQRVPPCRLKDEIADALDKEIGPRFPEALRAMLGPAATSRRDTVSDTVSPPGEHTVSGTVSDTVPDPQESRIKNQESRDSRPSPGWITDPEEAKAVVVAEEGRFMPSDLPHLQGPAQKIVDRWRELSGSANAQGRALAAVVKLLAHRIAPDLLLAAARHYGRHCEKIQTPPIKRVGALTFYGQDEWRGWLVAAAEPAPPQCGPDLLPPGQSPMDHDEMLKILRSRKDA